MSRFDDTPGHFPSWYYRDPHRDRSYDNDDGNGEDGKDVYVNDLDVRMIQASLVVLTIVFFAGIVTTFRTAKRIVADVVG